MAQRVAIRDTLIRHLTDTSGGIVVSLTGPWGSGKTHLWREVADVLRKRALRPLYVSLFGIASIADARAALLTEAYATPPSEEGSGPGLWSSTKKRALEQLPVLLQLADNKLGAPLLARMVDPTALLPDAPIVCLDDVERAAASLPMADILGFANLLAEKRNCRVLLIYNDEHIRTRAKDSFPELSRAYRERVVRHSHALSPDVHAVAAATRAPQWALLTPEDRKLIVGIFDHAKCVNMRTLFRAFDRAAEVRRILGEHTLPAHIAFTVALTGEEADGPLADSSFYEFHPVKFVFARHSGAEANPESTKQFAFYNSYYSSASLEYEFSKGIYTLVSEGSVDAQTLFEDVRRKIVSETGPVHQLLSPLNTRQLLYFSDQEHRIWLEQAQRVLATTSNLPANQVFSIHQGAGIAAVHLGIAVPRELAGLISDALLAAARSRDGSLEQGTRHFVEDPTSIELIRAYDTELRQAVLSELRQTMLQVILDRDSSALFKLLGSNANAVGVALELPMLEELHAVRTRDRRFYFDALLALKEAAGRSGKETQTEALMEYVCACCAFENLDKSDAHRMRQI